MKIHDMYKNVDVRLLNVFPIQLIKGNSLARYTP